MAKTRRNQPKRPVSPAPGSGGQSPAGAAPAARQPAAGPPRPAPDPRVNERIDRQRQRAAIRQQQEQFRRLRAIALSAAAFLIVAVGIIWLINNPRTAPTATGRAVPIVGWEHIPDGQPGDDYNSNPPTSGKHYASTARDGVHTSPIPNEFQVHNLEHGQILIQYTCTDCPDLAKQLEVFVQRYPKWVLVAPNPNPAIGARIALTAWGWIDTFDEFDEQRITNFIEARKNRGRENVIME